MNKHVFVYGTLKRGYGNNSVLGNSKYLCEATTISPTYTMYNGGFPFVSAHNETQMGRIKGELYLVEEENIMEALDHLEGVPYMYIHENVQVEDDGGNVYEAIMYVASPSTDEDLRYLTPMTPNEKGMLEWTRKK